MFTFKKSMLIGIFTLISTLTWAQVPPCLSGWKYRTPVLIDNTNNPKSLSAFQVEVVFNTQDLIANNKTRLDGADIRFVTKSGAVLPYCVENNTFNTSTTKFWVKIPSLQASQLDSIYVFYGQPTASSIANPDTTFEFFDDFLGASVNEKNWSVCPSSDITITNGTATFNTKTHNTVSVLKSKKSFTYPVVIEQSVLQLNQITSGVSFLGLQSKNGNGYAMAFDSDQQSTISLRRLSEKTDTCLKQIFHTSNTSTTSTATQGVWSFSWIETGNQVYKWPGGKIKAVDVTTSLDFSNGVSICLGNQHNTSQLQLDWARARKYTEVEPTCTVDFAKEVAQITSVTVSSNTPVCETGEIQLKVNSIVGVEYKWTGPQHFTSSEQNPKISSLSVLHSGYYKVTASVKGGCYAVSDSVFVTVNPNTETGTSKGYTTVCSGSNIGDVAIENKVGDILRWEFSTTGHSPWTTINDTTSRIGYKNLLKDSYYRAIVKSGVCKEEISDSIKIAVDANTIAGVTLGEKEVCSESNSGTVVLNSTLGSVKNWQFLEKGSSTWVDVLGTSTSFTFSNLSKTTYYRAKIQNGVCLEKFSDSVKIKVNPLPVVDFDAAAVCLGIKSSFVNKTTIEEGTLRSYVWDFNDGHTSAAKQAQNLFETAGDFQVNLRVESDKFCLSQKTKSITVNPLPKVEFFHTNVCKDALMPYQQNVSISSGSINELKWDFGDRIGTSELLKGSYLYQNSGNYTVKLVAISDNACKDSVSNVVTIFPRASLDFKVNDVFLGEESSFINNSTISTGNLTYEWRFDDGQSSILPNPKHTYKTSGTFAVKLISTSSYGLCKDTIVKNHVVNDQTKADFAVNNVCLYDSAAFDNLSKIAFGTLTYVWDFGDGGSSKEVNPKHIYENPGTYLVKLTATSNLGSVSSATNLLTIYPLPTAKFVAPDVCDKFIANYSNLSSISGGSLTYNWDFGDGSVSEEELPTHLYAQDGTYKVQLVASSAYSCRDTLISEIDIHPLPQTLFYVDAVCDGFVSFFHDSTKISNGKIESYAWDFGDGTNSIVQHPEKQFLNPGSYLVSLTTVSEKLCTKKYSQLVKVIESPIANFSVENVCFGTAITPVNSSSSAEGQITYTWDFGDSQTSEFLNPNHLYALPKNYAIKLVVNSTYNCKDSVT